MRRHGPAITVATLAVLAAQSLSLTGCGLMRTTGDGQAPVPAGPLGPVLQGQGGGAPVECRGVPIEQCQSFGNAGEPNVVRWIITCVTVCTPLKGDVRVDVLRPNGATESMGQGSYATAGAAPLPDTPSPPIATP
jgi:hypothetical protein